MCERLVYTSSSCGGRIRRLIFERIIHICQGNDYSSVLYLSPNQFTLKEAMRDFLSFLKETKGCSAFIPFNASTLYSLATSLQKKKVITEDMRRLLLCEILNNQNMGHASELSGLLKKIIHYLPDIELTGFKEKVRGLIFEEKVMRRLDEAIDTLQEYNERVREMGFLDYEQSLKGIITSEIPRYETVVIDGFYDPTPLELRVIDRVINNSGNVYISAEEDTGLLRFIKSMENGFDLLQDRDEQERRCVVCDSYPSMEDEVEGLARRVNVMIMKGVEPFKIVITFPTLSRYLPMIKRVFRRYGIPLDIPEIEFLNTPPFVALNDMLTSIENDYPRNEFLSFLTSPCFPGIHQVIKEYAVTYSYRAEIIKGKKAWLSISEIIMATSLNEPGEDEIERLKTFQKELSGVIKTIEGLMRQDEMPAFIDLLEEVLEGFGFFNYLKEFNKTLYTEVMDALSDLRAFTMRCRKPAFIGKPWFYLREFLRGRRTYNEGINGVRVIPYELAAGVDADMVFFGGLTEEEIPSKPPIDPYLPETVKRSIGIPDLEYYINRQKRYFKRLLNISKNEPYLCYPSNEGDRVFLPSPFLDWNTIRKAEELHIFSKEDILIYEGSVKGYDVDSKIMWSGDLTHVKGLKKKINEFTRNFINVTDIDLFRRCPFRFYIERILNIEPMSPPRFEVDARLWGNIAHKTMERLFRDNQIQPDALLNCLEETLKELSIKGFWADVAGEIFKGILPSLLYIERRLRKEGFIPLIVEEKITGMLEGLRLKGKIDRVDIKRGGIGHEADVVILLDYKTGGIDGESLQLPLYAYLWQGMSDKPVIRTGFYSLRDRDIMWYPKDGDIDGFIRSAIERFQEIITMMRDCIFSVPPSRRGECRNCYHKSLCKLSGET